MNAYIFDYNNNIKNMFKKSRSDEFITLGGELPAMTMTESIVRLVPGVIKEEMSWQQR